MLTILPVTVCTSVAQPTEQYGHTLGVVFAFLMRSSCARASVGARLAPSPARPPSAVPPAMPEDTFKKFRRETSINTPLPVGLVERAFTVPVRPSWFDRGEPAERRGSELRWHAGYRGSAGGGGAGEPWASDPASVEITRRSHPSAAEAAGAARGG